MKKPKSIKLGVHDMRRLGKKGGNSKPGFSKIVVIGGSAGATRSLCALLKHLPPDFAAPVLAVIHIADQFTHWAETLQRCVQLKVITPQPAEHIAPGRLYVPVPNRHLVVKDGCVGIAMGPRECRARPSVDTLFRNVARSYRQNVIAVVLSGALDDGSAGATIVKARGGLVLVEDPATAEESGMPENVRNNVKVDYCLKATEIGDVLAKLVSNQRPRTKGRKSHFVDCESAFGFEDRDTEPQGLSCPECGGVLAQVGKGSSVRFRCHVGHAFSLNSLTEAHADALERAIWLALRQLNERRTIYESLVRKGDTPEMKKRYQETTEATLSDIEKLHEILEHL